MRVTFKSSGGEKATLAICTVLMATLATFIVAVAMGSQSLLAVAFLAPSAAILIGFVLLIGEEARAAFRLRIELDGETLRLDLPRRRGHVVYPAVRREAPLSSVAAIETRGEVFRQVGVTAIQQNYRLRFRDGASLVLGADRQMKRPVFGPAAEKIAERIGAPVADIGMVDGGAGFLAVVGTSAPDWSTPSLGDDEIGKRRAASIRTFQILTITAALVTLARLIARR